MITAEQQTTDLIDQFNIAFNSHDVEAIMALMTDDVIFDNTVPPDGRKYIGQAQVAGFWNELFSSSPGAWFDAEDIFASGDRCTVMWKFTFDKGNPEAGHVRGADIFRVRDGKVAEKFSYVKG